MQTTNTTNTSSNETTPRSGGACETKTPRKIWTDELKAEQAARMRRLWADADWRAKITGTMSSNRSKAQTRAKLRDCVLDAARERARKTGVVPHWAPRRVAALEPGGAIKNFESIRQCAAFYDIKENNMRRLIKVGGTWHGIKFLTAEGKL